MHCVVLVIWLNIIIPTINKHCNYSDIASYTPLNMQTKFCVTLAHNNIIECLASQLAIYSFYPIEYIATYTFDSISTYVNSYIQLAR